MREIIETHGVRATIRWKLLAGVSAAALLASVCVADAADDDRPTLWIELGGQLEGMSSPQQALSPPFLGSITQSNLLSALDVQRSPNYAISEEGAISLQPVDSSWVFSASVRYGRSGAANHRHQQTKNADINVSPFTVSGSHFGPGVKYPYDHVKFADGTSHQSETHLVLDFQAGKDVGLGLFGNRGSSVISAGVRIAQFNSKSTVNLHAVPDLQYPAGPIASLTGFIGLKYATIPFHAYTAAANIQRSFNGVGPSLSWNESLPVVGNGDSAELTLDWGANVAVLFGRQKVSGHHQTTSTAYKLSGMQKRLLDNHGYETIIHFPTASKVQQHNAVDIQRDHSVAVPNLGGFAGLSLKWSNAKMSLGYRADFFFGAMDGGIDTRKEENRNFFGPYASVSIGLGG